MRFVPILSRPALITIKNSWTKQSFLNKHVWRDTFVFCSVAFLLYGLFGLAGKAFGVLHKYHEATAPFLPAVFNSLLCAMLALVFFSSCTFTLTNLYLAEDLELILASPISKKRFFINKFLQIFISSSWIIYLAGIPCMFALARAYNLPGSFYFELLVLTLPLIVIPVALALICITLAARYISGNQLKILLPVFTVILLLAIFNKSHVFFSNVQKKDLTSVVEILKSLEAVNTEFLVSSWLGESMARLVLAQGGLEVDGLSLLYLFSFVLLGAGFLVLSRLHDTSLSRIRNASKHLIFSKGRARKITRNLLGFLKQPLRAALLKEFKIFARDFSHLIQISIILLICLFYLYNFQSIFHSKDYFTMTLTAWQNVTFLCNVAFGTLIITSLCTRFVYSSVSLEGHSLWVLLSSPLSVNNILRNKFYSWLSPVILFSTVILISGCFALQSELYLIGLTAVTAVVTSFSLTALAVSCGAIFANFNWVHSSQIFASTGSLCFIFSAIVLTGLNLLMLSAILFLEFFKSESGLSDNSYLAALSFLSLLFVGANFMLAKIFLRAGARSLAGKIF